MKRALAACAALALLSTVPAALAQGTHDGVVYVTLPHSVDLKVGAGTVQARIAGTLQCEAGTQPPGPVQASLSPAAGRNDGHGPAWTFATTSWSLEWTAAGNGNYSLDARLSIPVQADGYGARGYSDELTLQTAGLRGGPGTCKSDGFTIATSGEHAHISVPGRPGFQAGASSPTGTGGTSAGAPGPAIALLALAILLGVVLRRR